MNRLTNQPTLTVLVLLAATLIGRTCAGQVTPGTLGTDGGVRPPAASPRQSAAMPLPPTSAAGSQTGQADVVNGSVAPGGAGIPLPPTGYSRSSSAAGTSGGWVSGTAALQGGPFPAYMTGYGTPAGGHFGGGTGVGTAGRPFSNYSSPQAVSPYMNLFRSNSSLGTAGNYYTLVRPQIEQQRVNQQLSRQINEVRSGYGNAPTGRGGSVGGYFMNYYGFFSAGPR
ncbi:hypothetical protein [Thermopirellula anaerolimosa]